ncbi:ABC transporter, periplasmic substrate-binding protein [Citrifermentans bemidjiense Bem]|uniref:ABC transporter, periplasmic substrate-binding protein n=1 Tax=Citrifermentans bemidjiense (strain ATCC BAA-1014 / DSM 16622 / JCM 12645 / Bem) TaxID=404380 RepID=B5EDH0_CITBB|nr:ABC transporter, periplasmic substrate-binding protein [Citrifermentans bemidjiense Bem]
MCSKLHTCCIAFAILLLLALPALSAEPAKRSYTLAVVPNQPAITLHKNWTPFVQYLSKQLGVEIELKLYDKIDVFLSETQKGAADLIYSAPNMFYLAYQKQKYVPLVRSSHPLQGQVFVRKDSPYLKVSDLKGKTIASVGPRSICSVITRHALLTGQGAIDYNSTFSGSTINVAKSVLLGKVDAGVTLDTSVINDAPEMLSEFRVILRTEKIAPHPLAAHPRVPKKLQDAVTRAVLALDQSEEGRRMLKDVKLVDPIKANFKRDYSFFAKVDLEGPRQQAK